MESHRRARRRLLVAAVDAAARRRRDDRPAFLAGLFLAVYVPFVLYAASGMEAVAFTSLVTLALVGPATWQPIVAPLLVAMRPEGVLVAGIDVLALAWRRERRRWIVATAIAAALTLAAIAIHRWAMYHALAPNTYYAKVAGGGFGHVRLGLEYVGGWMLAHILVVAFLDRAIFLRRDFWEAHPRRDTLDCVPVGETALAAFASR
jgi:hypothetical protein